MEKEYIGEFEELVLLLIVMLEEEAYGLAIRNALKEQADRTVTIGAVHGTVNRLEKKGFIQSRLGGATELRGGRRKRLFTITAYGKKVLQKSRDVKVNLWNQIPELALNQFDSLQMKHQNPIPPKSAEHFLSRFCKDELLEEILGDLQEYYDELAWQPRWKRNLFYWFPSSFVISLQSAEG